MVTSAADTGLDTAKGLLDKHLVGRIPDIDARAKAVEEAFKPLEGLLKREPELGGKIGANTAFELAAANHYQLIKNTFDPKFFEGEVRGAARQGLPRGEKPLFAEPVRQVEAPASQVRVGPVAAHLLVEKDQASKVVVAAMGQLNMTGVRNGPCLERAAIEFQKSLERVPGSSFRITPEAAAGLLLGIHNDFLNNKGELNPKTIDALVSNFSGVPLPKEAGMLDKLSGVIARNKVCNLIITHSGEAGGIASLLTLMTAWLLPNKKQEQTLPDGTVEANQKWGPMKTTAVAVGSILSAALLALRSRQMGGKSGC